uniref:Uncharacterized protein n=1 Tax=Steinernema glaseri TaxID=37863 RepID=A0A1I7YG90_9BILA
MMLNVSALKEANKNVTNLPPLSRIEQTGRLPLPQITALLLSSEQIPPWSAQDSERQTREAHGELTGGKIAKLPLQVSPQESPLSCSIRPSTLFCPSPRKPNRFSLIVLDFDDL